MITASPFWLPDEMNVKEFCNALALPKRIVYNHCRPGTVGDTGRKDGNSKIIRTMYVFALVQKAAFCKIDGLEKICTMCKTIKPIGEFSINSGRVYPHCLECGKVKANEQYRKNILKDPGYNLKYRHYRKNYRQEKKEYFSEYAKSYYQENKKKVKDSVKKWKRENYDKVQEMRQRRRGLEINNAEPIDTTKIKKSNCYYCGKRLNNKYHIDHIVPLSAGGANMYYNLCACCPKCNMSKHAKSANDFIKEGQLELVII
jgi:5-methylcytosine-specific restriction endonuclease McrA